MQALAEVQTPEVPELSPVDWMRCRPWLVARRDAIMDNLFHEGAQLLPSDHGLRKARVDALHIFDRALAELSLSVASPSTLGVPASAETPASSLLP